MSLIFINKWIELGMSSNLYGSRHGLIYFNYVYSDNIKGVFYINNIKSFKQTLHRQQSSCLHCNALCTYNSLKQDIALLRLISNFEMNKWVSATL